MAAVKGAPKAVRWVDTRASMMVACLVDPTAGLRDATKAAQRVEHLAVMKAIRRVAAMAAQMVEHLVESKACRMVVCWDVTTADWTALRRADK